MPSRFTVISTVPTDGAIEGADNVTVGSMTTRSYDPYKSSRIIENVYASHAKIVIHRNGSTANKSSRSSTSRRGQSGSFKSTSTRSRQKRGGRYITAPLASRASRHSLSSIQSSESTPYMRPAARRKRGVDFSHVRMQPGAQHEVARAPASIAGDGVTRSCGYTSAVDSIRDGKSPGKSNKRTRAATQPMVNMSRANHDGSAWNEEVSEFGHSIAKDCDDAFNSSLLDPESYLRNTRNRVSALADATPTPAPNDNTNTVGDTHPWDRRPLPPTPSTTTSAMDGLITERAKIGERSENLERSTHINHSTYLLSSAAPVKDSTIQDDPNRRIVSAPIYSQYSTQWGKDKIPLPSINETYKGTHPDAGDRSRIVSAPAWYPKPETEDRAGFEFLSRQDNTIRLVTSPSTKPYREAEAPELHNARKHRSQGDTAYPQPKHELNLRERYMNDGPTSSSANSQGALPEDVTNSTTMKKKPSWFKRGSKDRETVFNTKVESSSSRTDRPISTATDSSPAGPAILPAKKKSFNIAFWRNSKDESQVRMSLVGKLSCVGATTRRPKLITGTGSKTGSKTNDKPSPEPAHMFSRPAQPPCHSKWADEGTTRNIEPQQSWLARLFRVKPATKYLCFCISRRRARQEIVILLKEWRKYGIRDVEVDKERNIVFARVGEDNCKYSFTASVTTLRRSKLIPRVPDLNLKGVAFAAEIMTVIEHGKRSQLCIVRITQERGAASSFHKVIDTMNSVFSGRGLLVVEKRKIKMMIKTLNS